ncbi:MAG TPA: PVC-type heme-binding CxxCH protein, partial [Pirellulales bacterium]
ELIYQVPDIEHPSVVTCDDEGNLFVGQDPMDMRGPTREPIDSVVRITWDAQGKPKKTLFCDKLAAVFGLVWKDGWLYVLHAPFYSRFKDTNGDGAADVREDLAAGFGPPAGIFGFNDHIVTGTRLGMDGLIYISVGDKGVPKATGSDGSTLTLEGGGVIRMRPDGSQLEIFSSGTRNHLDVAMNSLDDIFTYDNTDDGLGWWTRFTHHIPTGYYGYPYDYHPHRDRHLPRISEHGGGSPVGAACYREAAWPTKYRDVAFMCDWGKRKVQVFFPKKSGATYTAEMEDFMVPEEGSQFNPQDVCFSPDGRDMYVADWNFGGWVNPQLAGRLYRVRYVGGEGLEKVAAEPARHQNDEPLAAQIESLAHPAHSERMRAQEAIIKLGQPAVADLARLIADKNAVPSAKIHAIWAQNGLMDGVKDFDPTASWTAALLGDASPDVRAQAARAIGYRKLKSGKTALVNALRDADPTVRLWSAVGLGRLGDAGAAGALFAALTEQDEFARFAMIQALRTIGAWDGATAHLNSPDEAVRTATRLALTEQYSDGAVAALADAAKNAPNAAEKAAA